MRVSHPKKPGITLQARDEMAMPKPDRLDRARIWCLCPENESVEEMDTPFTFSNLSRKRNLDKYIRSKDKT